MEQGETVSDFAPKKLARQLDFTAVCRASANATLPDRSIYLCSFLFLFLSLHCLLYLVCASNLLFTSF